jgi:nitrogen fixation-related uncharacterized protein
MSSLVILIEVAVTMLVLIAGIAYWAYRHEKAEKSGKPKPRRRIW